MLCPHATAGPMVGVLPHALPIVFLTLAAADDKTCSSTFPGDTHVEMCGSMCNVASKNAHCQRKCPELDPCTFHNALHALPCTPLAYSKPAVCGANRMQVQEMRLVCAHAECRHMHVRSIYMLHALPCMTVMVICVQVQTSCTSRFGTEDGHQTMHFRPCW